MYPRRLILEQLKDLLATDNYFKSVAIRRLRPAQKSYPAITLYCAGETNENMTIHQGPRPQDRNLNINIVVWEREDTNGDATESKLDIATAHVESAIAEGYNSNQIWSIGLTDTVFDDPGELEISEDMLRTVTLVYRYSYSTTEGQIVALP